MIWLRSFIDWRQAAAVDLPFLCFSLILVSEHSLSVVRGRQFDPKTAAGQPVGFHAGSAAHFLRRFAHNHQPDAGPFIMAAGRETLKNAEEAEVQVLPDFHAALLLLQ